MVNLYTKNKLFIIILGVVLAVIVGLIIYIIMKPKTDSFGESVKQIEQRQYQRSVIESVVADEEFVRIEVKANPVLERKITRMPELVLSLADRTWFTDERMQLIGVELGFNENAVLSRLGNLVIWTQDNHRLTINSQIGTVDYALPFNLVSVELPKEQPSLAQAKEVFNDFMKNAGLPVAYFDLENATETFLTIDADGILVEDEAGFLLKMEIPYQVSDVPLLLSEKSQIVIDANKKLLMLKILVPNITQTDDDYRVMGLDSAVEKIKNGVGVVIDTSEGFGQLDSKEIVLGSAQIYYYLGQAQYSNLASKRALIPIYVFSGDNGKVAVIANN